jgi:hypothetical protein
LTIVFNSPNPALGRNHDAVTVDLVQHQIIKTKSQPAPPLKRKRRVARAAD